MITFTENEAALLAAFLNGEADFSRFMEGGDYRDIVFGKYAPDLNSQSRDAFIHKVARLP